MINRAMALGKKKSSHFSRREAHDLPEHCTSDVPLNIPRTMGHSETNAMPGDTDVSKVLPDLQQAGSKPSLGTRKKKKLVLSRALYARTRQCFIKRKRKSADVSPSFSGSWSFLSWNKDGENVHMVAIRMAELTCDEQAYLSFDDDYYCGRT